MTRQQIADALGCEADRLHRDLGVPRPAVEGKLLRPLVAWAAAGEHAHPDGLAVGALAIQAVHEASLLHDDILDRCEERRGRPSLVARAGEAAALVEGDHLLTAAYRMVASTGSLSLVTAFARAVERTVAGEKAQAGAVGRWLSEGEYREMVACKSGELFGVAASLAAHLRGDAEAVRRDHALGLRIGCLYQRVDDFLDLCPSAELGKPPLLDLAQEKWTWPLAEAGVQDFPGPSERGAFVAGLFSPMRDGGASPMRRALARLEQEIGALEVAWRAAHPSDGHVPELLGGWRVLLGETLDREESNHGAADGAAGPDDSVPGDAPAWSPRGTSTQEADLQAVRAAALALGNVDGWTASFARHGRSFRFAARLFPPEPARLVAGVYAFCRLADDLVDQAPDPDPERLRGRLDALEGLVRQAWESQDTGIPLLDQVLGETAARGVPALYAEELLRGVAMDLEPVHYPDMVALRRYSYRVASVVGLWLTELFGTRDATVLRRAESLGHAMQLTNILRDVGEDWRRGRLYLPLDALASHGLSLEAVGRGVETGVLPPGWPQLVDALLAHADREYALAFEAIPALPPFFQRPVAVAARVYQGIHGEIVANGHDTLTRRAWTGRVTKLRLGAGALLELRRARRSWRSGDQPLVPFASLGTGQLSG
jgi:15-cis-phytoene synthase